MKSRSRASLGSLVKLSFVTLLALGACGEDSDTQRGGIDANTMSGADAALTMDVALMDGRLDGTDGNQPAIDAGAAVDGRAAADAETADAQLDATVAPIVIDFETVGGVTAGAISGAVAASSRLSDQLQAAYGVSFNSLEKPYVALVKLGAGHATSGVNGIGSVSASDTMAYSTMTITFSIPANPSIAAVTNQVSIRGDTNAIAGTASLEAFDVNQVSLGKVTVNDLSGGLTLAITRANIHSISLTEDSHTIAFDDLVFNALSPAAGH